MSRGIIKLDYDPEVDAAYLKLTSGKIVESEEVSPGLIVDRDARRKVVGVEILQFGARFMPQKRTSPKRKKAV